MEYKQMPIGRVTKYTEDRSFGFITDNSQTRGTSYFLLRHITPQAGHPERRRRVRVRRCHWPRRPIQGGRPGRAVRGT